MIGGRKNQSNELQMKIHRKLVEYQNLHGYAPSIRELAEMVGKDSTSHIQYHLKKLAEKGLIDRDPGKPRSIRQPRMPRDAKPAALQNGPHIPIVGRIQAGNPIAIPGSDFSLYDPETYLDFDDLLPNRKKDLFALEVQGDSMIDAGVDEGDIVVLMRADHAQNGEMVAAWIKSRSETTLKDFYREEGRVRLQPANDNFDPIYVDPADVEIQGVVVSIIKLPHKRKRRL